jgi:outer membrane murein-binding lipoprotein Lpp
MKVPLRDQSPQQADHLTMSSDDTVQFTDIDSDTGNHGGNRRIFSQPPVTINIQPSQPPVTINVFGAGAVTTGESNTATTTSTTGISNSSDSIISRLESQIAALSYKVEQLASQVNSAQPQPRLQVDSGQWRNKMASASQRVNFSKTFESAPRVIVSISKADIDCNANFRLNVFASEIDSEGFTIHANSWLDTVLFECGVSWVAIGNGKE